MAASFVTRSFVLDDTATESFVHAIELAMIGHTRCARVALRLELPIDASARQDGRFLVGIEVCAGVER